jgi:DNA polymerase zeta
LEGAIKVVESTPKWGARVVYGDTDSLFVLLKGKSREEAFNIGAEIAETVTAANPKPVKLKFEKVMQPCILQVHNIFEILILFRTLFSFKWLPS